MPRVLVPLVEGCEELEAVTIIDLLRRAKITVISAGLETKEIKASRGVVLIADQLLEEVLNEPFDLIVLPGGLPGADYLNQDPRIHQLLQKIEYKGAICAAPKVLAQAGLLNHKKATSYPNVLSHLQYPSIQIEDKPVVVDGKIITSRGPGTAMDFALQLIEILTDSNTRNTVELGLVR